MLNELFGKFDQIAKVSSYNPLKCPFSREMLRRAVIDSRVSTLRPEPPQGYSQPPSSTVAQPNVTRLRSGNHILVVFLSCRKMNV